MLFGCLFTTNPRYACTMMNNVGSYSDPLLMFKFVVSIRLQYKFCVDGVWQHDENQPFARGDYGSVNTIFIAREPDMINSTSSSSTPGRSNMDVDYDIITPTVRDFLFELNSSSKMLLAF